MSGTSDITSTFHGTGRLESLPWRFLHGTHDFHRIYADRRNLPYEVDNALFVILKSVGIEFLPDRRIFGILLFMLIEDPFKGAAVPQTIFPRFRRDAAEGRLAVNFDGALIGVCPKDWDDRDRKSTRLNSSHLGI